MEEIRRRESSGEPQYIFRRPRLEGYENKSSALGYCEEWYAWDKSSRGIRSTVEALKYVEIVSPTEGIPLGTHCAIPASSSFRFYDSNSFLINGAIVSHCTLKPPKNTRAGPIAFDGPPNLIIMIAESKERIVQTARLLNLPLKSLPLESLVRA